MVEWADATNDAVRTAGMDTAGGKYAITPVCSSSVPVLPSNATTATIHPRPERSPDMADIPTDWRRPLVMRSSRFVSQVTEGYRSGERYCFILGAGASITSGIKGGVALAREWQAYLRAKEAASPGYIRECAAEYEDFDYERDVAPLFAEGYEPKSADYFSFYDLRFANMPTQAYAQLQALMEAARPSAGYHCLAVLLTDTENRLVITTNFDSLVEDALSLYNARRPLVLGHESLAPFMRGTENRGRVKIAKVHRDLLLHPKNRKREMAKLDEGWEGPLREALSGRTPIVVGYAGGDDTLMGLLRKWTSAPSTGARSRDPPQRRPRPTPASGSRSSSAARATATSSPSGASTRSCRSSWTASPPSWATRTLTSGSQGASRGAR
jgi:hypothetical protein